VYKLKQIHFHFGCEASRGSEHAVPGWQGILWKRYAGLKFELILTLTVAGLTVEAITQWFPSMAYKR